MKDLVISTKLWWSWEPQFVPRRHPFAKTVQLQLCASQTRRWNNIFTHLYSLHDRVWLQVQNKGSPLTSRSNVADSPCQLCLKNWRDEWETIYGEFTYLNLSFALGWEWWTILARWLKKLHLPKKYVCVKIGSDVMIIQCPPPLPSPPPQWNQFPHFILYSTRPGIMNNTIFHYPQFNVAVIEDEMGLFLLQKRPSTGIVWINIESFCKLTFWGGGIYWICT